MSFKISKGRLSFKIGEVINGGTSSVPSGKLELALWLSCQAKLKFISRGKYYIIVTLSELDQATNTSLVRDSFTFSKRLRF